MCMNDLVTCSKFIECKICLYVTEETVSPVYTCGHCCLVFTLEHDYINHQNICGQHGGDLKQTIPECKEENQLGTSQINTSDTHTIKESN